MVHNKETGMRNKVEDIKESFLKESGCVLFNGFDKISNKGDAVINQGRASSYMEYTQIVEYAISLDAKRPLSFLTEKVYLNNEKNAAFCFSAGFGNGSPLPQPSGKFNVYVNDVFCLAIRNVNYSFYWRGENSEFVFSMRRSDTAAPYANLDLSSLIKNESQASFGVCLLVVGSKVLQEGQPAKITIEPISDYSSTKYFYLGYTPNIIFQANIWPALTILTTKNINKSGGYSVYFGDIHTHSGQVREQNDNTGCGMRSMDDNYNYAKGAGGLNFYALTDHEWQILPDYEERYFALADSHNKDGEFVCLKAFEHTSPVYGHRNIYFKGKAKVVDVVDENKAPMHPKKMIERLADCDFFSIPHHPSSASHPCNTELLYDEDVCIEVYSNWGSSEYWGDFPRGVSDRHDRYWVKDIFKTDKIMGIVSGADAHDGCPGNSQSPYPKHQHQFHFCGSGLTAVLCLGLTREEVYNALKNRRCYGTTGAPIILDISCNENVIGSVICGQKTPPVFMVKCKGTNSIKEIRVVKNGRIIYVYPCCGMWDVEFTYVDRDYDGTDANYYFRVVQVDMESAWSSPFFFRNG